MNKKVKIVFKGCLIFLAVFVLIIIGLVLWFWETITILSGNKNLEGEVGAVPEVSTETFPAITKGKYDWINWLGPNNDGSSNMTDIPKDWSKGLKKLWEVDYLCQGRGSAVWSAPVILGNRLIVCGRDNDNDLVFCLNPETGKSIWKSSYLAKASKSYGSGNRGTPWIDDDKVFTFGRSGDLVCWNLLDGQKIWHKNVKDSGGKEPKWGWSNSPLVTDALVVVQGGGDAHTIAYDKMSGDVKWKSGPGKAGYAAIRTMEIEGKEVILSFYGTALVALDPHDGKQLWKAEWKTSHDVNATTPMVTGDKVFISSGYGAGGELLKVTDKSVEVLWKNKVLASHHSDPFIIDGYIYGYTGQSVQNKGTFKCVDLQTGIEKWSSKEMGWGTGVYVGKYILCMDNKGNLFLMKPDPGKFIKVTEMPKVLGKIKGATWTKPIVANGKLYLRFMQKLICFELK